jgi:hypothetical protein
MRPRWRKHMQRWPHFEFDVEDHMASTYITLVGNETRLAGKFRRLVDQTIQLQDDMSRMKAIMDEVGAATNDWAAIEAKFGFQAGAGQAAYTLLAAAKTRINATDVDNFCNRIG